MDILNNFKKLDSERIEKLYDIVEGIPADNISELLKHFFIEYSRGAMGAAVVHTLKAKIAAAVQMKFYKPPMSDDDFIESFSKLDLKVKQSLIVTMANDISKLGVFSNSQVMNYLLKFSNVGSGTTFEK